MTRAAASNNSYHALTKAALVDNNDHVLEDDIASIVATLRTCAKKKDLSRGACSHANAVKFGLLDRCSYVAKTLISMYSRCGAFAKAHQVLEDFFMGDVVAWSALIAGYCQHGQGQDALNCYDKMQSEGLFPNVITFTCALKACGIIRALDKGKEIHDEIAKHGMLKEDLMLGNAVVNMYAKCGVLSKAQQVLEDLPAHNVVSWSTLIAGYAQHGQGHNALDCFKQMQEEGLSPNNVTFICLLKACSSIGAADKGQEIHYEIARHGMLGKDIVLGNALVDMYAKCGALVKAEQVLEELPTRDVVSWSALISGYAQHGQGQDALNCFGKMQREGIKPNIITFLSVLRACGSIGTIEQGEQIHDEIARQGLLQKDRTLGNALVDMYAKCGALQKRTKYLMSFLYEMLSLGLH